MDLPARRLLKVAMNRDRVITPAEIDFSVFSVSL